MPTIAALSRRLLPLRYERVLRRLFCLVACVALSDSASAALVGFDIVQRSDVLAGKPFGAAGAYEKLIGKARFEVDPAAEANRPIVDLELAPRNDRGLVEFSADLVILRPKSADGAQRTALLEVSNRGGKNMLTFFSRGTNSTDPSASADFGDGWLMERGYTLVWVGWQFDVPRDPALVRLYPPSLRAADGASITGPVRVDYVAPEKVATIPLGDRNHVPYPVFRPDGDDHTLTVRDGRFGSRQPIARSRWRFETSPSPRLRLDGDFEPGRIYELVYRASDPVVVGCGLAAVRDTMAWLKHDAPDTLRTDRAYGFGISQSGRFLRHFLYQGFNADESGRRVFDGMLVHVAGAGRGSFNHRFAQPSRDGQEFSSFFYPTDLFPFTDLDQTDPDSGARDGLAARYRQQALLPRIFYTNTSYEYYGRAASLIHTTPDGDADFAAAPYARIYQFAGGMHFPGPFPPAFAPSLDFLGRLPLNPNDYRWSMRALLLDLDEWVRHDRAPPASRHPTIARGTLVALDRSGFPALPGLALPTRILEAYRVDYGARFDRGIVDIEPPRVGKAFPTRVPRSDTDGNEIDGIRMPDIAVPLASYTGWNLRDPKIGAGEELANYSGAVIPFALTRSAREAAGDPRPAVAERYADVETYLDRYREAVDRLVDERFLLARDREALMARGRAVWDWVHRR